MDDRTEFRLRCIGQVRSTLRSLAEAPRQGNEGAPDAWLEIDPDLAPALVGIRPGDDIIVVTWLHRSARDVLQTHPRNDPTTPLTGVFATRSPDRPNPLGLHRVTVHEVVGTRLRAGPIEAIDGTPIVDLKAVLGPPECTPGTCPWQALGSQFDDYDVGGAPIHSGRRCCRAYAAGERPTNALKSRMKCAWSK